MVEENAVVEPPSRRLPPWFWWVVGGSSLFALLLGLSVWRWYVAPRWLTPENPEGPEAAAVKPKPDFEKPIVATLPSEGSASEPAFYKPGHWTGVVTRLTANNDDFRGDLWTEPQPLPGVPFELAAVRPVTLPRGNERYVELLAFLPARRPRTGDDPNDPLGGNLNFGATRPQTVETSLGRTAFGSSVVSDQSSLFTMQPHQYFFVVLARDPESYKYLDSVLSVATRTGATSLSHERQYIVKRPAATNRTPLPANPLAWSSVAYLLWDTYDHAQIADQQQALVDWLHWGGQLVVSGPDSLAQLRGSFLDSYLPRFEPDLIDLPEDAVAELIDVWNPTGRNISPAGWSGISVSPAGDSGYDFVPNTGKLVVERRVGRGRIVVTAFRLNNPRLAQWQAEGVDSLLNACLLRRPARSLHKGEAGWRDLSVSSALDLPQSMTGVRYLTREADPSLSGASAGSRSRVYHAPGEFDEVFFSTSAGPGVAGWNDQGPISREARDILRKASAIEAPDASKVLMVILVYVAVLAPINWLLFRILGRVELAWAMVPVLSIGFTAGVVYFTELDIGFDRARTELAVIEFQGTHPRAHVTRYMAVYTSLADTYEVASEDSSTLIQPFAMSDDPELLEGQLTHRVAFHTGIEESEEGVFTRARLDGFAIPSAATRMLHLEQMRDLGGGMRLVEEGGAERFTNGSILSLKQVRLVRRTNDGLAVAWLGDVGPGEQRIAEFKMGRLSQVLPKQTERGIAVDQTDFVDLAKLTRLTAITCPAGGTRLVAWSEEPLPGVHLSPPASKIVQANVIIAHLEHPAPPAPAKDLIIK